jgi:hypothetical protein
LSILISCWWLYCCSAGCLPCRLVDGCTPCLRWLYLLSSTRYSAFLYPSRHPRRCSGTSKIPTPYVLL